ncbi:hypothetical protein LTR36_008816 [Oleoguttula mirabilis]|uniref:Glutamine synthetase n=1 Tax=Oleoguttula mirabilis TaxID=1507867 RepID=A0AAV9J837_9PEZI|nr:hypothetical protein LTR36_008816 [Oleoguttula mirabilis]
MEANTEQTSALDELKHLIRTCPVIDNHAHNILRPHQLKAANLLTITTEASGDALEDAPKSLAHLRAVRQLRKLYGLPQDADWAAIVGKRVELLERDPDALMKKCFEGTQTILIDDGLDSGANIERWSWHDKYTLSPCKRIVRIETVAADILSALHQQGKLPVGVAIADEEACSLAWVTFISEYEHAILDALDDEAVVGFKSVVCYRTGLDVQIGRDIEVTEDGLRSFIRDYLPDCVARNFRVEAKHVNDALVISVCKLIAADQRQRGISKPLQFHTGLGDNDISLLDSNPACLQPLIKHFPTVPIVLLHSSYPYTREAGYLATVYKNVYLDIGEVFPMVSRDGQEKIVRQALEITPTSKILWSTDGHHFPETYWLANVQGREALEKVLCEYVEREDLSVPQAGQATKDILFSNSNSLYNLGLKLGEGQELATRTKDASTETPKTPQTQVYSSLEINAAPSDVCASGNGNGAVASPYDGPAMDVFFTRHSDVQFIIVQWLDFLGTLRSRWLPINSFRGMIKAGSRIGMTKGNLGTLQNDHVSPVCDPVGQVMVEPDVTSLRLMHNQVAGAFEKSSPRTATVMARLVDEDGKPLQLCPRAQLQKYVDALEHESQIHLLVGFEIEVIFLRRRPRRTSSDTSANPQEPDDVFEPLDTNHAWGTLTDEQLINAYPLVTTIATALTNMGIELQTFHSESGAGQYEFVLPPLPPVQAVDVLVQARQCIQQVAAAHQLRATYHPMPFPGIGTAAHAHISLNSRTLETDELECLEQSFMARVLEHLPGLCALTMPEAVSYGRVIDDSWTGGTWVAWGTQNREVPLRRVGGVGGGKGSRWELRCLDGMANMYLALGAIVGAGLAGVRSGAVMTMKDCGANPTKLSALQKHELGITQRLPTSIEQAVEALEQDLTLAQALAPGLVHHYVSIKRAEQEMLDGMPELERRVFLIERY